MQDTESEWLRLSVVAKRLGVSRETARVLVVDKKLKARRATDNPRGMYLVHRDECSRHLADSELTAA